MADEGDHYTVDEAASILGLSPVRVRQMCRSNDLLAERREGRIEGLLGPWRIRKDAVHSFSKGQSAAGHEEFQDAKLADATTVASAPPGGATANKAPETPQDSEPAVDRLDTDTPSEASELLSESVRNFRERADALVAELERLEGRLEFAEIQDLALREALRRETERSDGLRAELEAERACRRGDS
ncbi:MAG: helix-turn-helix domain-containing protein [Actinomycetota bacterium]|nr:helix-turn-helix domain-containing protein [Actinomycetota bacterium]